MNYKKHKNDIHTKGAYFSFIQEPFKHNQSQRYFKKYFDVYECAYSRKNPRYHNRELEGIFVGCGNILNKIFNRRRNTRKKIYKKLANKAMRHNDKAWIKKEAFDIEDLKNGEELIGVPKVQYISISWYID